MRYVECPNCHARITETNYNEESECYCQFMIVYSDGREPEFPRIINYFELQEEGG